MTYNAAAPAQSIMVAPVHQISKTSLAPTTFAYASGHAGALEKYISAMSMQAHQCMCA